MASTPPTAAADVAVLGSPAAADADAEPDGVPADADSLGAAALGADVAAPPPLEHAANSSAATADSEARRIDLFCTLNLLQRTGLSAGPWTARRAVRLSSIATTWCW